MSVLLLSPPGWALNIGSPHLGLPLLKGYLLSKNIDTDIVDCNLESTQHYSISISNHDTRNLKTDLTLGNLNKLWFSAQDKMKKIAEDYNGNWSIQDGFNFKDCNLGSSADIQEFSKKKSPFTDYYKNSVIPFIKSKNYKMIGISVTIPSQLLSAFELARIIRNSGYDGIIVLGGNTITRLQDEINLNWVFDIFDIIAFYSGEDVLYKIYNAINSRTSLDKIQNITFRSSGEIKTNEYQSLNEINFEAPDFSGLEIGKYWGVNVIPQVGGRGCYYNKCSFCSIPYSWNKQGFIGFSSKNILQKSIMESVFKYSINRFSFIDEALHPKMLNTLIEIVNENDIDIKFEGYGRFEEFWYDKVLLSKLSKVGFKKVFLGLETIHSSNRDLFNKKDKGYKALELIKLLNDYGIKVHLFIISGYPGTNEDDSLNTVKFVLDNERLIDTVDISPFQYAKHTNVKYIDIVKDKQNDWNLFYNYTPQSGKALEKEYVLELNNYLENIIWEEKPHWLHPIYRLFSPWEVI